VILLEATCRELREQLHAKLGATLAIDLAAQTVTDTHGTTHAFQIDAVYKERLLKGLDEVGLVLEHLPAIEAFEKRHHAAHGWLD
jgi:3-isopropylmalate/(R)-2-methylmalate dehydratase small subunit